MNVSMTRPAIFILPHLRDCSACFFSLKACWGQVEMMLVGFKLKPKVQDSRVCPLESAEGVD
jgi:hypothetical protein